MFTKVCEYATGALFVIMSKTPSLRMLGLLQVLVLIIFYLFLPALTPETR